MGKLINRIQGSRLLISSLSGSASSTHVKLLGKPRDLTSILEALPGNLDIKGHSPSILYLHEQVVISYKFNERTIGEFPSFQLNEGMVMFIV